MKLIITFFATLLSITAFANSNQNTPAFPWDAIAMAEDSIQNAHQAKLKLVLVKKGKPKRQLKSGTRTVVWISDSVKLKGRLHVISYDSILLKRRGLVPGSDNIRIDSTMIGLNQIRAITKPLYIVHVIQAGIGGFFAVLGGSMVDLGEPGYAALGFGIAAAIIAPIFFNVFKRKFKIGDKWKVEVGIDNR